MSQYITFEYKDGSKCCGESENGALHGCGVLVEPSNKGVYEGLWVNGSQISGVYTWPGGKQYMGDWKGAFRSGLGVETRADGTNYSGEYSQNTMGPLGVLNLPTHGLYLGMWDPTGVQEGDGVEAYADGGFYRGQYKNGQRSGYGTRSSSGYEQAKEIFSDPRKRTSHVRVNQRPSVAFLLTSSMPRTSAHTSKKLADSADNLHETTVNWSQVYEGEWANDKRSGHGILKVSDYFTYYGQWKDNIRTGYGVLVHEGRKDKKKGGKKEEVEEGHWENGKLVEPIKHSKIPLKGKNDLQMRVEEAHQVAIKAAAEARDKAKVAETKANAAAAKSKVAEMRANEARQHAESASKGVESAAMISKQAMEDACRIKGGVKIIINEPYENSTRPKFRSGSLDDDKSTSYSYLQFAAEHDLRSKQSGR